MNDGVTGRFQATAKDPDEKPLVDCGVRPMTANPELIPVDDPKLADGQRLVAVDAGEGRVEPMLCLPQS